MPSSICCCAAAGPIAVEPRSGGGDSIPHPQPDWPHGELIHGTASVSQSASEPLAPMILTRAQECWRVCPIGLGDAAARHGFRDSGRPIRPAAITEDCWASEAHREPSAGVALPTRESIDLSVCAAVLPVLVQPARN
ncbi:hypothetical protein VTN96DRAFT_4277 [Rasamsonia emersonii]